MRYHARDLAVFRARLDAAMIILALGDAVAGDLHQRPEGALCLDPAGTAPWRGRDARHCPDRHEAARAGEGPKKRTNVAVGRAGRRDPGDAAKARAGAAVPQSPRLCAAGPVQGLRREDDVAEDRFLAGRTPQFWPAGLSPDRLFDEEAGGPVRIAAPRIR